MLWFNFGFVSDAFFSVLQVLLSYIVIPKHNKIGQVYKHVTFNQMMYTKSKVTFQPHRTAPLFFQI